MDQPLYLEMTQYKRLKHFEYFKGMAYPYVGITCEIDVTAFYQWVKDKEQPFFLSFLWCVAQAANEVPEFRQRISGDQIAEYPFCPTAHTVSKEDGTYAYCTLDGRKDFSEFVAYGKSQQEHARLYGNIDEKDSKTQSLLFISTVPWMTYTAIVQPVPMPADSNPRITWGKFQSKEGVLIMPVSVLCNHALVDGKHIGDFYEALKAKMASLIKMPLKRVVGEVVDWEGHAPEVLKQMRDRLEELKKMGIEGINE